MLAFFVRNELLYLLPVEMWFEAAEVSQHRQMFELFVNDIPSFAKYYIPINFFKARFITSSFRRGECNLNMQIMRQLI